MIEEILKANRTQDIIEALDQVEALYRGLKDSDEAAEIVSLIEHAYLDLAKARQISEEG